MTTTPQAQSGTTESGAAPEPGALPDGRFEGREAFRQALRDAMHQAAAQAWREIIFSDADFEDWPLGERAFVEDLQAWSHGGRRFVMLAKSYDPVLRLHPRFVAWRRTWSHIIECRRVAQADRLDVPSLVLTPNWALQRIDVDRCVGVCSQAPERRVALRETLDHWLRQSAPGFPATTLGL
ncbi:hypothetical protein [Tibeticola sp.]|uniref:hypothetical protein n=1 Tax=Tibeticola sp. TaxID=2005368 RepID=UPI0025ED9EA9|nr:hypothetical protein [Tibeticola sp.]